MSEGSAVAPVIEVRNLHKSYGKHVALAGLDLTVGRGEVYGFLGRNGAGKSTTIRILMGITQPTAGEVRLFGERFDRDLVRLRQRIGYVAQEQSFYGWMTGAQMGRFVRGFFPSWDEAEWRRVVRLLDVPLDRKIEGFSGGMKVKLALALALAHRPPLLVLDEPTAGLDPVARREFLDIVRAEAEHRTTFFSTHLVDEIERVAHRVGVVDEGRAKFEGSVEALGDRVRLFELRVEDAAPETALDLVRARFESMIHDLGIRVAHAERRGTLVRMMLECADPKRFDALEASDAYRAVAGPPLTIVPLEEAFIALVRKRT